MAFAKSESNKYHEIVMKNVGSDVYMAPLLKTIYIKTKALLVFSIFLMTYCIGRARANGGILMTLCAGVATVNAIVIGFLTP